jgi:hypothetical protein
MPFDDDVRALPVPELRVPLELAEQDARLLATLAARLELEPAAVVRVALLTLAQPARRSRWA